MLLCNATILPIKTCLYIEDEEITNNDQVDLKTYQHLVWKLIYLIYNTKSDILFIMK